MKLVLIKKPVGIFDSVIYGKFIAASFTLKSSLFHVIFFPLSSTEDVFVLIEGCVLEWKKISPKFFLINDFWDAYRCAKVHRTLFKTRNYINSVKNSNEVLP